jgi:prepilin-type processing-associated H-X9-DG protein
MRRSPGFTIIELLVVLVVLFLLLAFLSSAYWPHSHGKARQASCASNEKQMVLAAITYAQDYAERFPPVVGAVKSGGVRQKVTCAGGLPEPPHSASVPGLLRPYTKSASILRCPSAPRGSRLTYLYNDLAAEAPAKELWGVASTVLIADGEDQPVNAGHAHTPDQEPEDCRVIAPGGAGCAPGRGATVQKAPARHADGANYAFADGHVKWYKPESIYFPPRASASRKHGPGEPDPAGNMSVKERHYAGTFHLR